MLSHSLSRRLHGITNIMYNASLIGSRGHYQAEVLNDFSSCMFISRLLLSRACCGNSMTFFAAMLIYLVSAEPTNTD